MMSALGQQSFYIRPGDWRLAANSGHQTDQPRQLAGHEFSQPGTRLTAAAARLATEE